MGTLRKFSEIYRNWWHGSPTLPPYSHICQIGDPVLRSEASAVNPNDIRSKEIQFVIQSLRDVMTKYKAAGLAAPQIGIPLQIFAIEFPESRKSEFSPEIYKIRGMATIPFKVFINPKLQVVNYEKLKFTEACESIRGYSAEVHRFREVSITGLDDKGESVSWQVSGWGSRIVQHEMDHLQGKLFTDIMLRSSFTCTCWQSVNLHSGRIKMSFLPK